MPSTLVVLIVISMVGILSSLTLAALAVLSLLAHGQPAASAQSMPSLQTPAGVTAAIDMESPQLDEGVNPIELRWQGNHVAQPENSLVGQPLNDNDVVLAEQPATVDAALGQGGPWCAVPPTKTRPGARGGLMTRTQVSTIQSLP
jgi:hypothetical protein